MRTTPSNLAPHSIFNRALRGAFPTTALAAFCLLLLTALTSPAAEWTAVDSTNDAVPGRKVDVKQDGKLVARLIYGEGEFKPFLHVYGIDGELLTNPGVNKDGKTIGLYPHHRGIFIGWKIESDLGTYDFWHMTAGATMELVKLEKVETTDHSATLLARVEWRAPKKDANGNDLVIGETRRLIISRPDPRSVQVDARFTLTPARDVKLVGDLQHSGIHYRAADEVNVRKAETAYLFEPAGVVKGDKMEWCRLLFPTGSRWYTAQEMNAPSNPVEELSMRDYGRFGYFFKKNLKKGETQELTYRFVMEQVDPPANAPKESAAQTAASQKKCEERYRAFVKSL